MPHGHRPRPRGRWRARIPRPSRSARTRASVSDSEARSRSARAIRSSPRLIVVSARIRLDSASRRAASISATWPASRSRRARSSAARASQVASAVPSPSSAVPSAAVGSSTAPSWLGANADMAARARSASPSRRSAAATCQLASRRAASAARPADRSASSAWRRTLVACPSTSRAVARRRAHARSRPRRTSAASRSSASDWSALAMSSARRSASARRSRMPSGRPTATATCDTTAPPSRVTAIQPGGRSGWSASAASRSGSQIGSAEERSHRVRLVASDRLGEWTAAHCHGAFDDPTFAVRRSGTRQAVGHDEHPPFGRQLGDVIARDEVRPDELAEGRFDRGLKGRIDHELVIDPTAAPAPRGAGDAAGVILGQPGGEGIGPAAEGGERLRRGSEPLCARGAAGVGRLEHDPRRLSRGDRLGLACDGLSERRSSICQVRFEPDPPRRRVGLGCALIRGPSFGLCDPASSRLLLGLASGRGASDRGKLFALGLPSGPQAGKLGDGLGERPLCLRQCRLAVEIAGRHGYRRGTTLGSPGPPRPPLAPPRPGSGRDRPPRAPR